MIQDRYDMGYPMIPHIEICRWYKLAFLAVLLCFFAGCCTVDARIENNNWIGIATFGNNRLLIDAEIIGQYESPKTKCDVKTSLFSLEKIKNVVNAVFPNIGVVFDTVPCELTVKNSNGGEYLCLMYENYIGVQECPEGVIQLEEWVLAGDAYPSEPKGTTLDHVILSKSTAETIAYETVSSIGATNLDLSFICKARILLPSYETFSEGWFVTFGFSIDGNSPIYMGSVLPNNRMNVKSIWFAPTLPETIILYIDETGIKSFQWGDPLTIVESTIEKTKLLPINKVFAKIIRYFRSNYNWDCVVSTQDVPLIEKIVLTDAVIISSPFSRNDGKVKPAWAVFYSTEREKENYSPPSIIFIDAENGIVLNPFILNEE